MLRKRFSLLAFVPVLIAWAAVGCTNQPAAPAAPPDTRAADEAAIRAADANFAQWAAAKDLDKCVSLYADDAVAFAPGMPAVIGKDNIRKFISGLVSAPGLQVNIHIASVDVARSGDIAIDRGTVDSTVTDKKGKATAQTVEYVLVWKKQADGSWKIAADTSANQK
ncbi:MAG TPA: SgcJ/EcaC family oxidoreductase [Candidatus Acidoferrum sp.]|nr:SgcJ/EcaC family oxidoreductase [Candidatus Acidoferrum sp.]